MEENNITKMPKKVKVYEIYEGHILLEVELYKFIELLNGFSDNDRVEIQTLRDMNLMEVEGTVQIDDEHVVTRTQ
jgi:hypothetical protein